MFWDSLRWPGIKASSKEILNNPNLRRRLLISRQTALIAEKIGDYEDVGQINANYNAT